MSLYLTYRPKTLDDIVGQEHVVTTLRQAIAAAQLSHAYLFAGTRGTGKTSTARILARHLLTKDITDDTIRKQVHKAIDDGNLVDFVEIDAASNTGVDNIRDLIEKIQFTPVVASSKVYVIDEVHMLSKGAFNALLKTLEEPPSYAYFILATTELHKIPATIQSRCQRFLFRQISEDDLIGRLQTIAKKEGINVEDDAFRAIARAAQGGMRDAISLLDQLRSLPTITAENVAERVGESGHAFVDQVMTALESGERNTILNVTRKLEEAGIPLDIFVRLLLSAVRDDLRNAASQDENTNKERHRIDVFLQCVRDVRSAPVPGLVLESALLSLIDEKPNSAPAGAPLGKPVTNNESQVTSTTKVTPPVAKPSMQEKPAPAKPTTNNQQPITSDAKQETKREQPKNNDDEPKANSQKPIANNALSLEELRKIWPEVIKKVQPASARMSLSNGQLHTLEDSTLTIRFSSNFHREKASVTEGLRCAIDAITAATGKTIKISTVLDSDLSGPLPEPEQPHVDLASAVTDVF